MSRANDMAYPVESTVTTPNNTVQNGLTIREEFVKAAMQGLCVEVGNERYSVDGLARRAVQIADAALAALAAPVAP